MILRWPGRLALALVAFMVLVVPVLAAETINSFATHVVLRTDGTVEVTETLDVNVEGRQIRRGIFRDIPTVLVNEDGSRLRSELKVLGVERNGRPEPYSVEGLDAGYKRIRIGDPDNLLGIGVQRYTIRYTMSRQGRRFVDHDELYWNATGNYWDFPILAAVTSIELPPGAVIADLAGYTGVAGSTERAVDITRSSDTTAIFRATRVLGPGEGMTVAAMFQKGVLAEPSESQNLLWWLSDHRDLVMPLLAVLVALGYYLVAWVNFGRDPQKGVIIPLFHPPKGFSPALVHYVHRMGWEGGGWTAFTASLFDLGVKGLVRIDNKDSKLKVTATGKQPTEPLPPGEKVLFDFFGGRGTVDIDTANGPKIHETRAAFVRTLENENRQVYFNNHTGFVVLGVLISILMLGAMVLFDVIEPVYLVAAIAAGIAIGMLSSLLRGLWKGNLATRFIFVVWVVIFATNMVGGLGAFFSTLRIDSALIAVGSIVVINIVFGVLMRAPTIQGRKVMDEIDGLKMYLETAEEKRLNYQDAPPMTVERFERLLPYAIALKVEKLWSRHFEAELARHAVADASGANYSPSFYRGTNWSSARGGFANTVAATTAGLSAAMIASQPASSSSSGFSGGGGGGGSSGGGGGGGGGGGW